MTSLVLWKPQVKTKVILEKRSDANEVLAVLVVFVEATTVQDECVCSLYYTQHISITRSSKRNRSK